MAELFVAGMVMGLAAGFSPGPLLALVIGESLRRGTGAGVKVALAPVLSDAPIIVATLWLLSTIGRNQTLLGLISLAGSFYVLRLAWESISAWQFPTGATSLPPFSLWKGVLVNLLSPHPYLFWAGVGGPLMTRGFARHDLGAAAFLAGFYLFLVGTKILLAVIVGRSRTFIPPRVMQTINRLLAILLVIFAVFLFRDAWQLLFFQDCSPVS